MSKEHSNKVLKRPQLAATEIPDIEELTYPKVIQPKLDGICCLAVNGKAYSRTMKLIPNLYVQSVFEKLNLHGFHGELVLSKDGLLVQDFNEVQSSIMSVDGNPNFLYVVYDYWDSDLPYMERYELICSILPLVPSYFQRINSFTVASPSDSNFYYKDFLEMGFEGAILRNPNALYKQGRHTLKSQDLLKLKPFHDDEAVIVEITERMTNQNELGVSETGYAKRSSKKEGKVPAGVLGSIVAIWKGQEIDIGPGSLTEAEKKEWFLNKKDYIGKTVTFKYQELSKYGVPRFPTLKGLRDKNL